MSQIEIVVRGPPQLLGVGFLIGAIPAETAPARPSWLRELFGALRNTESMEFEELRESLLAHGFLERKIEKIEGAYHYEYAP